MRRNLCERTEEAKQGEDRLQKKGNAGVSGAKKNPKWLCQRAAWRTQQQDDDATESGTENAC